MIRVGKAELHLTDNGCFTRYPDGTTYGAHPHDTDDYREVTERLGYGSDIMAYCVEHEFAHHVVSEWMFSRRSAVLWELAHGRQPSLHRAVPEEALAQTFQRYLRADERPIIGDVRWSELRDRAISLLG